MPAGGAWEVYLLRVFERKGDESGRVILSLSETLSLLCCESVSALLILLRPKEIGNLQVYVQLWKIHDQWRFLAGKIICKWAMDSRAMLNDQRVYQWQFQDPKMEVRQYHISRHILGAYSLT